jgi:hypothetical protein
VCILDIGKINLDLQVNPAPVGQIQKSSLKKKMGAGVSRRNFWLSFFERRHPMSAGKFNLNLLKPVKRRIVSFLSSEAQP